MQLKIGVLGFKRLAKSKHACSGWIQELVRATAAAAAWREHHASAIIDLSGAMLDANENNYQNLDGDRLAEFNIPIASLPLVKQSQHYDPSALTHILLSLA